MGKGGSMESTAKMAQEYKSKQELKEECRLLKTIIYNLLEQSETEALKFKLKATGPDCMMHISLNDGVCQIIRPERLKGATGENS